LCLVAAGLAKLAGGFTQQKLFYCSQSTAF
jgi:hypothetical protein